MLEKLNLLKGKIIYNDFHINKNVAFQEQIYNYKEDILQIAYGSHYLIDLGWYPEFDPQGFFSIKVIKNLNWQKPLLKKRTKKIERLVKCLNDVIKYVDQINRIDD